MKKHIYLLIFAALFSICSFCSKVYAESAGGTGGGTGNFGECELCKFVYSNYYPGTHSIKITVYNKETGAKIQEQFFTNNKDNAKTLNSGTYGGAQIVVASGAAERLSNNANKTITWTQIPTNQDFVKYLKFDNLGTSTKTIIEFLRSAGNNDKEIIQNLALGGYTSSELSKFALVIEPATLYYGSNPSQYYLGTYWDFHTYAKQDGLFRWAMNNRTEQDIGNYIKIQPGEITINSEIYEFLGHFSEFKKTVTSEVSKGAAIILLSDVVPNITNKETKNCKTTVGKGDCNLDLSINEPTDKDCVVNNDIYRYKNVGDCGVIYCSQKITTDLNDFYGTFNSVIQSGRYFNMNNAKIDVTKTCYLKTISNNSNCNNWQQYITKDQAGTMKLELVSSYNLIENSSQFNVTCDSYKNGVCQKATAIQHIEYGLEPNTNRYISIVDMAGTGTATGNSVVDLGSENLTTPISLSTGTHNYTINYQNSLLSSELNRMVNTTIKLSNLILNYSYDQKLTSNDLVYSCEYTAQNSNDKCNCAGECCDSNCKVVGCVDPDKKPGGFPSVVYRPINLKEAFPGQSGVGRNYGSNWYGYAYDNYGNVITKKNGNPYTKEEYYINYNRGYNDYDVYQSEPLYVIKLDYDTMKKIRQYNDANKNNYNDFKLECTEGEGRECISSFLHGNVIKTGGIIESGTCKNINHNNFYSCIQRAF